MKSTNTNVYVLGSARIPFVKSMTNYANTPRKELMVAALNGLVEKCHLTNQYVDDTALGALFNSSTDWNLARECLLSTKIHPDSPAYNVQRACGTSLETTWQIALKIFTGSINLGISGGVDTNSDMPLEVSTSMQKFLLHLHNAKSFSEKLSALKLLTPKIFLPKTPTIKEPRTGLSMGEHCELMVEEWQIPRKEQDEIALQSHQKASKAYHENFFSDLIVPFQGLNKDTLVRENTSLEKLAQLKPSFKSNGSLTAGNSSPLTDGAASVLLGNEAVATRLGLKPLAQIIDVAVAGVDFVHGEGLLMAPTKAVNTLLKRQNLALQDFDFYEIHEAFAGQVLCHLKAWESADYCKKVLGLSHPLGKIDRNKLNVTGSSIAIGHPFAATGARIVGTLAKLLSMSGSNKRGLISICTAGGMGIAAILQSG